MLFWGGGYTFNEDRQSEDFVQVFNRSSEQGVCKVWDRRPKGIEYERRET